MKTAACPGFPMGNPILGHNILGNFCPILDHFWHILGHFGGIVWHCEPSLGSKFHIFYEFTLCKRYHWHDVEIMSKNIYWCRKDEIDIVVERQRFGNMVPTISSLSVCILKGHWPVSHHCPEPRRFFGEPASLARDNILHPGITHNRYYI